MMLSCPDNFTVCGGGHTCRLSNRTTAISSNSSCLAHLTRGATVLQSLDKKMSIKQMSMTKGRQSSEGEEREIKLAAEDLSDLSLLVPVAASVCVKVRHTCFHLQIGQAFEQYLDHQGCTAALE